MVASSYVAQLPQFSQGSKYPIRVKGLAYVGVHMGYILKSKVINGLRLLRVQGPKNN